MKHFIALLLLAALPAFAQELPSPEEINARLQAVSEQRNRNADEAAFWQAKAVALTAEMKKAKEEAAKKEKECK